MRLSVRNNYTGHFANETEPGGIGNATHNTFPKVNVAILNIVLF
jgi:hypothetical protein